MHPTYAGGGTMEQVATPYAGPGPGETQETEQRLDFLEMLADTSDLKLNGIPWREAYVKLRAIIEQRTEGDVKEQFQSFLKGKDRDF